MVTGINATSTCVLVCINFTKYPLQRELLVTKFLPAYFSFFWWKFYNNTLLTVEIISFVLTKRMRMGNKPPCMYRKKVFFFVTATNSGIGNYVRFIKNNECKYMYDTGLKRLDVGIWGGVKGCWSWGVGEQGQEPNGQYTQTCVYWSSVKTVFRPFLRYQRFLVYFKNPAEH